MRRGPRDGSGRAQGVGAGVGGAAAGGAFPASGAAGGAPLTPASSARLFTVYPSTKVYFKHLAFGPDETQLLTHGQRVLEAVGVAVRHMDNLRAALSPLADLHAQVLRVDPSNFPVSAGASAGSAPGSGGEGAKAAPLTRPLSRSC